MENPRFTNHLARETSPYLLQHAHNPVEWFPWGTQALEKARKEDKPILLSIGYSACHWCHVMERESFEDASTAQLMNEDFVNIKVDREERPDLDQIYMSAVQLMTGSGGWPLTVFLTPDGKPFYGGTYFPPNDAHNRPGFKRVLATIAQAYRQRRSEVIENAQKLVEHINSQAGEVAGNDPIDLELLDQAQAGIASQFDSRHGGFGAAPKFPPSMTLDFLLRHHHRTDSELSLHIVNLTLHKMAFGGLYDQLGGGFHRYSTDERWLVPHFEKMLYDNALLARLYTRAFQATGIRLYRRIAEETLDWVGREMRAENGGFYSTLDADSEGVEGKFYVWKRDEFDRIVGDDAGLVARYFDVTAEGNFEGQNILNVSRFREGFPEEEGVAVDEIERLSNRARRKLWEHREKRIRPQRDEKILSDWNGLMLRAYADAASCFQRRDYRDIAESNAEFMLSILWDGKRLLHAFKDGHARFNAYVDDYANFADGLLGLYELTFEERWLSASMRLTERMIDDFWDETGGGFFFTSTDHEPLVARTKEFFDNATPSGNSVAADLLARLGRLLDRSDFTKKAERICQSVAAHIRRFPSAFGKTLCACDFLIGPTEEVALVGDPDVFLPVLRKQHLPRTIIAAGTSGEIPLLQNRPALDGKPTAYLCRDYICKQPTTEPAVLEGLLEKL
jgi:uncharacterized protein YyaL (SSP411 family)